MKKFFWVIGISLFCGVLWFQTGCSFNPAASNDATETSISSTPAGNAHVGFKIILPDKKTGKSVPLAAIRPSTQGTSKVTFRLILANPGNKEKPSDILSKTVDVNASNSAEATFDNIPTRPVVGQVKIDNGHIAGWSDFHGAADLGPGTNTLDLAPTGSKWPQDVVAHVVENAIQSPDLMAKVNFKLVLDAETAVQQISKQNKLDTNTAYTDAVEKFLDIVRPPTYYYFVLNETKTTLIAYQESVKKWERANSDLWQSIELWATTISVMLVYKVLRQGLDGFGYVAWKHSSLSTFGITKIDTVTGNRLGYCRNQGHCDQAIVLSDGSIVVGGSNYPFE